MNIYLVVQNVSVMFERHWEQTPTTKTKEQHITTIHLGNKHTWKKPSLQGQLLHVFVVAWYHLAPSLSYASPNKLILIPQPLVDRSTNWLGRAVTCNAHAIASFMLVLGVLKDLSKGARCFWFSQNVFPLVFFQFSLCSVVGFGFVTAFLLELQHLKEFGVCVVCVLLCCGSLRRIAGDC